MAAHYVLAGIAATGLIFWYDFKSWQNFGEQTSCNSHHLHLFATKATQEPEAHRPHYKATSRYRDGVYISCINDKICLTQHPSLTQGHPT